MLGILSCFYSLLTADFLQSHLFKKNYLRKTIRVSNNLDSEQDRQNISPDLGSNCLRKLSADVIFSSLCCCQLTFFSQLFKYSFKNTIKLSNSFDLDQDQCSVGPDPSPNCLQTLSADILFIFLLLSADFFQN